jgi:hypothetical protein
MCLCEREEVLGVCGSRSPPRLPSRLSRVSLSQLVPRVSGKLVARVSATWRPGSTSLLPSPRVSASLLCRVLYVSYVCVLVCARWCVA